MVTEKDPQDSFRELFSCSVIYLVYQRYFCRLGNWATCYLNLKCFLHFFPRHISMSIQYIGLVCEELVSVIVIKLLLSLCRLSSEESIIVLLQICCSVMLILFGTLFSATSRWIFEIWFLVINKTVMWTYAFIKWLGTELLSPISVCLTLFKNAKFFTKAVTSFLPSYQQSMRV